MTGVEIFNIPFLNHLFRPGLLEGSNFFLSFLIFDETIVVVLFVVVAVSGTWLGVVVVSKRVRLLWLENFGGG